MWLPLSAYHEHITPRQRIPLVAGVFRAHLLHPVSLMLTSLIFFFWHL